MCECQAGDEFDSDGLDGGGCGGGQPNHEMAAPGFCDEQQVFIRAAFPLLDLSPQQSAVEQAVDDVVCLALADMPHLPELALYSLVQFVAVHWLVVQVTQQDILR